MLSFCKWISNEIYPCIKRNARPNNNQLINYYLPVCYLLRIQQYPVNSSYNIDKMHILVMIQWKTLT